MTSNGAEDGFILAGEMPLVKNLAKKHAPPTRAQLQLLDVSAAIYEQPDAAERAFMARQLVLCTLPHSNPGNVEAWTRRTGNASLTIQAGWDAKANRSVGYPYGIIPRLLLFWMTTEVQHTKNRTDLTTIEKRTLQLGHSLADFMREVGLDPSRGGKRSDARRLHDQMKRLIASQISFEQTIYDEHHHQGQDFLDMKVAPRRRLWWDPKQPEQGVLWHSWIELGEHFYNALIELPVPVDMRALRALKRSPLALDLYAWICYRAFVIVKKNQPAQFMAWQTLRRQFGTDYGTANNFQKKTAKALRKIAILYPGLTISKAKGGFTIHATRLAISTKPGAKPNE